MLSVTGYWCASGRVRLFLLIYVFDSTMYAYFEQYLQHICFTKTSFVCSSKQVVASCYSCMICHLCWLTCCVVTIYTALSAVSNCWSKCIWFQSPNLSPPNSEATVAFGWMQTFHDTFKFQDQTWGRRDSQQNVSAKMHLVPVIQLEIEIARTRRHQILRRQSHLPEWRLSKTLSNFKNRHEVVEIANRISWTKCI